MNIFTISVIVSAVLAILKLTGAVAVSWLIVAGPVLISVALSFLMLAVAGVLALAAVIAESRRSKK